MRQWREARHDADWRWKLKSRSFKCILRVEFISKGRPAFFRLRRNIYQKICHKAAQNNLIPPTRRHKNGRIHRTPKTSTIKQLALLLINNSYLDCEIYSNKASIDEEGTQLLIIILRLVICFYSWSGDEDSRQKEKRINSHHTSSVS